MTLYYLGRPVEIADGQKAEAPCFVPGLDWNGKRCFFWTDQLKIQPWGDLSLLDL